MTGLASALISELSDGEPDKLADLLAPRIAARIGDTDQVTTWFDVPQAANHLRCPVSRVYALTSARRIPFHKDGSRTLFRRDELDEWVRSGGAKRP